MLKLKTAAAFLIMMLPLALFAQNGKFAQIKGKVTMENAQGEAVSFATVHLLPQDVYTSTELDGTYLIKNVEPGKTSISVQFVGMETIDTLVNLAAGQTYTFNFKM